MESSEIKEPQILIAKAERLLRPKWYEKLFFKVEYDEVAALYTRAARLYKKQKEVEKALECFYKAEEYDNTLSIQKEILAYLLQISSGDLSREIDSYALKLSDNFISEGCFTQASRVFENVACHYDKLGYSQPAIDYANKAIKVAGCENFHPSKSYSILVCNLILSKEYDRAFEMCKTYLDADYTSPVLEFFNRREFAFLASLLALYLERPERLYEYHNIDSYQVRIIYAYQEQNMEEFETALSALDGIRRLTREQISICLALKEKVSNPSLA